MSSRATLALQPTSRDKPEAPTATALRDWNKKVRIARNGPLLRDIAALLHNRHYEEHFTSTSKLVSIRNAHSGGTRRRSRG